MARIEWQPLAIPDIGESALRAQQAAGNSVRTAFQDLSGVLDQWKGQRREENLTELYRRQNRFALGAVGPDGKPTGMPDVAGYVGDLADGDLMGDLSYLTSADTANARDYLGTLRSGRAAETAYADGRVDRTFTLDERAREAGDREAGVAVQRGLYNLATQLETGQITRQEYDERAEPLLREARTAAQIASIADTRGRSISAAQAQYTWDRSVLEDRQNDRVQAILNQITTSNVDQFGALTQLNRDFTGEDAKVLNAVRSAIPGAFDVLNSALDEQLLPGTPGAPAAPSSTSSSFAGTPNGSVYDTVLGNGQFGQPPKPISEMTIGEAISFGRTVLIPNTRGNRQLGLSPTEGSSAVGAYQFTQGTLADFAPRLFGPDWASETMSGENQEKLAEAIFQSTRGQPAALRARWQGLQNMSDSALRALGSMPWEQARNEIVRVETGGRLPGATDPSLVRTSQGNLNRGVNVGTDTGAGGRNTTLAAGYLAATQLPADTDAQSVAELLTGEGSPYAGQQTHRLRQDVQDLMNKANVTAPVAAWALRSTPRNRGLGERFWSFAEGNRGASSVNPDAAFALIRRVQNGDMQGQVEVISRSQEIQTNLAAAQAEEARARAVYARMLQAQAAGNGRADISRYAQAVEVATARVAALRQSANDPTISRVNGQVGSYLNDWNTVGRRGNFLERAASDLIRQPIRSQLAPRGANPPRFQSGQLIRGETPAPTRRPPTTTGRTPPRFTQRPREPR